jgi:hypothetical protein
MAAGTKKRRKRQWKRFKQTILKPVEPVKESKKQSTNQAFQQALDKVYGGTVTPLNAYLNEHATMRFFCEKCGTEFFNKAGYMVGRDSRRHVCTLPYADHCGNRFSQVSFIHRKKKKKDSVNVGNRLYEMILKDFTYQQIAKELGVNPALVKDHFKKEGLI